MFKDLKLSATYRHVFSVVLLVGGVWLAYGRSMRSGFAWDDYGLIVNNAHIHSQEGVGQFFVNSFWSLGENEKDPTRNFYRPLISSSYKWDCQRYGLNPRGFHLTNMIAHTLCAIMVYMLLLMISGRWGVALLSAVVWAVHPTHVENVCWVSGRTDVFCGLFYFFAMIMFFLWTRKEKNSHLFFWSILVAYILALMCKEVAITLPFVCASSCFLYEKGKRSLRDISGLGVAFSIVTAAYFGARLFVLGDVAGHAMYGSLWERTISIPFVAAKYLGLMFTIIPIDPHHNDKLLSTVLSIQFVCSLAICIAVILLFVWCVRSKKKMEAFLLIWAVMALAPTFKLGTFGDVIYADRFLYIPSVAFILCMIVLLDDLLKEKMASFRNKAVDVFFCCFYVVILVLYSAYSSLYWENGHTLFHRISQTSPDSAYVHFNLGNSLLRITAYREAYEAFVLSEELDPDFFPASVNKAAALNKLELYPAAVDIINKVNRRGFSSHISHAILGDAYAGMDDNAKAILYYSKSLLKRESVQVYNSLGEVFIEEGRSETAYIHFMRACTLGKSPLTSNNIGAYLLGRGEVDRALAFLLQAESFLQQYVSPSLRFEIQCNLARAYKAKGDMSAAQIHAKHAVDLLSETSIQGRSKVESLRELIRDNQGDDE